MVSMTMAYVGFIHLMLVCPAIRLVSVLIKEHAERRPALRAVPVRVASKFHVAASRDR